jgi:hypothetical protein
MWQPGELGWMELPIHRAGQLFKRHTRMEGKAGPNQGSTGGGVDPDARLP